MSWRVKMNKPERNNLIVITILFIIGAVLFLIAIDFFWRAMWQVHLDRQMIQTKYCLDYKCKEIK